MRSTMAPIPAPTAAVARTRWREDQTDDGSADGSVNGTDAGLVLRVRDVDLSVLAAPRCLVLVGLGGRRCSRGWSVGSFFRVLIENGVPRRPWFSRRGG